MSKFNVGDKVKVVRGVTPTGADHIGKTLTITNVTDIYSYDLEGTLDDGHLFQFYDSEVELVEPDYKAKYNDLVEALVAAYRVSDATLGSYIKDNLFPKPKQFDVTVRVIAASETLARAHAGGVVQAITEVP